MPMAKDAYRQTMEYVEKTGLLQNTARLLTAVSGGADSVFLFYVMRECCSKQHIPMKVIHVHHGIRGTEADRDAAFVESLCKEHDVPFRLFRRDIPKEAAEKHMTVEEAGRAARYQIFEAEAEKVTGTKVALAHQKNDQAETLLFNLARGTGLKGLCSLRPIRGIYIRPLLSVSREEEVDWLTSHHHTWCEDSTNADDEAARNRIRHYVIPYLTKEINAQTVSHLADTARIAAETSDFVAGEAQKRYEWYVTVTADPAGRFVREDLVKNEPQLMQEEVIRLCIGEVLKTLKDVSRLHVEVILGLFGRENGKFLDLPKGLVAEKKRGGVWIGLRARGMSKIKAGRRKA